MQYVNKVTEADINNSIKSVHQFTAAEATLNRVAKDLKQGINEYPNIVAESLDVLNTTAICVLVLHSGFPVVGTYIPSVPGEWEPELASKMAYADAIEQLGKLLIYQLRLKNNT